MKVWNIFASSSKVMDFIDPSSLIIDSEYTLSKKTPIMPSYEVSNVKDIIYAYKGDTIIITGSKKVNNKLWYQVKFGEKKGWLNSIALFGQHLK